MAHFCLLGWLSKNSESLCHIHIMVMFAPDQWLFLVPLIGGRWHTIPQLAVYTTYMPLIFLAFWGGEKCWGVKNATDPTVIKGNQKANQKTRQITEAQDTTATIPTMKRQVQLTKPGNEGVGVGSKLLAWKSWGKSIWAMKKRAAGWLGKKLLSLQFWSEWFQSWKWTELEILAGGKKSRPSHNFDDF